MKKRLKIVLMIITIVVVLIIGIWVFITLKRNKKAIDLNKFIEITIELGYSTSRTYEVTTATAVEIWTARKEDCEINFGITLSDIEKKTKNIIIDKYFNVIKNEYENFKKSSSVEEFESHNNYSKYSLSTDEYYIIVTRIDNTIIFAKVSNQNKDNIIDIFNKLGY